MCHRERGRNLGVHTDMWTPSIVRARRECATRGTATATDGDGVDGVDGVVDASSARGDGGVCGGGVRERGRRRWVLVARCGR